MIKFIMNLTRSPELTRDEFLNYWENSHAPLFKTVSEKLGARKYIQGHTLKSPLSDGLKEAKGMLKEFDGVAEVWFD